MAQAQTQAINVNPRFAFQRGGYAKFIGLQRLSPFYEDDAADFFFLAAFDGLNWNETTAKWNENRAAL